MEDSEDVAVAFEVVDGRVLAEMKKSADSHQDKIKDTQKIPKPSILNPISRRKA